MHQQEFNRLEACAPTGETRTAGEIRSPVDYLEQAIHCLEKAIRDHINCDRTLKADAQLLLSIPGLGETSMAQILA